jgi:hypothetical protein
VTERTSRDSLSRFFVPAARTLPWQSAEISGSRSRPEIVNDLRRELELIYRELADELRKSRRDLQTQFSRIAQLQQELDELKRKNGR